MLLEENSYGFKKRLQFIKNAIEQLKPAYVLDIGCGNGRYVTFPLAENFLHIKFLGIDSDRESIKFAKDINCLPNLKFAYSQELIEGDNFDLIIASEVIEHVEQPEEFLLWLKNRLNNGGKIIITLPNGYGPFEIISLVEMLLRFSGTYIILRKLKRILLGDIFIIPEKNKDTFAISAHINFFSFSQIRQLLSRVGLDIISYCPRTFLCGFGFDQLISKEQLINWNARIANLLPPYLNSGWMFLLGNGKCRAVKGYKPGLYGSLFRYLNQKYQRLVQV